MHVNKHFSNKKSASTISRPVSFKTPQAATLCPHDSSLQYLSTVLSLKTEGAGGLTLEVDLRQLVEDTFGADIFQGMTDAQSLVRFVRPGTI